MGGVDGEMGLVGDLFPGIKFEIFGGVGVESLFDGERAGRKLGGGGTVGDGDAGGALPLGLAVGGGVECEPEGVGRGAVVDFDEGASALGTLADDEEVAFVVRGGIEGESEHVFFEAVFADFCNLGGIGGGVGFGVVLPDAGFFFGDVEDALLVVGDGAFDFGGPREGADLLYGQMFVRGLRDFPLFDPAFFGGDKEEGFAAAGAAVSA